MAGSKASTRFHRSVVVLSLLACTGLPCLAQPSVRTVRSKHELVAVNDTLRERIERALLAGTWDTLRYWRDGLVVFERGDRSDTLTLLSLRDRALFNFMLGDHASLLDDVAMGRDYFASDRWVKDSEMRKPVARELSTEELSFRLRNQWPQRSEGILEGLRNSPLLDADRRFLALYWKAVMNDLTYLGPQPFPEARTNAEAGEFMMAFPAYAHSSFVKAHCRTTYAPAINLFGFDGILGCTFPTGGLSTYLGSAAGVSFSMNYIHRRWLFRAGVLDTDARVRKDLLHGTEPWPADGTLNLKAATACVGWRVLNTHRWRIAPMVGYAGTRSTYEHPEGVAIDPAETPVFAQAMIELDVEYKFNRSQPEPGMDGTWNAEMAARRRDSCIALRIGVLPQGYGPSIEPQGSTLYANLLFAHYWGYGKRTAD